MNPMDLKRGIDIAVTAVVKDIERISKKVHSSEEIGQIGTIASNGDKSIGKMIAEAMQKVGNEGVITVEEAKTAETELDVVELAVRPRLSPAVFHHQRREDGRRARGRLRPHP